MSGGRTDGRLSKKFFQPFFSHIRVLSKRIKRGYGLKNVFQPFFSHIRVLSKRIKRGYCPKNVFQPFLSHIRVLSKRIKRGYGPKKFYKGISICIKNIVLEFEQIKINVSSLKYSLRDKSQF